jgi:hypothetical protein
MKSKVYVVIDYSNRKETLSAEIITEAEEKDILKEFDDIEGYLVEHGDEIYFELPATDENIAELKRIIKLLEEARR